MSLLYIWIKEYGCFKNKEFSFSSAHKFSFEYKENNFKLSYLQNSEELQCIFNNSAEHDVNTGVIDNITVAVGDNGAGKTTLINLILDSINGININQESIFAFLINGKISIYSTIKSNPEITFSFDTVYSQLFVKYYGKYIQPLDKLRKENQLQDTEIIFCSNVFDSNYLQGSKSSPQVSDISLMGLIKKDKNYTYQMHSKELEKDSNTIFFYEDFQRQLYFICRYKEMNAYIPFKLPKYLKIRIIDNKYSLNRIHSSLRYSTEDEDTSGFKKAISDNIKEIYRDLDNYTKGSDIKQTLIINLIKAVLTSILRQILPQTIGNETNNHYKDIASILSEFLKYREKFYLENFHEYVLRLLQLVDINMHYLYINTRACRDIIDWLIENEYEVLNNHSFKISINENDIYEKLTNFFNIYIESASIFSYLDFSWPLSTGEYNFLSIFARFYKLTNDDKNETKLNLTGEYGNSGYYAKNAIILIDEADITFHPKWQQQYIKSVIEFLKDIYKACSIQLIITTHSPIILSDIPMNNTIYLRKIGEKSDDAKYVKLETFGANIYNIYNNSFFLKENNIGIMGEFARDCIAKVENILSEQELFDYYIYEKEKLHGDSNERIRHLENEVSHKLNYCKRVIGYIGEVVIKNALLQKYDSVIEKISNIKHTNLRTIKLENIIKNFNELNLEEQRELIKYIIDKNNG